MLTKLHKSKWKWTIFPHKQKNYSHGNIHHGVYGFTVQIKIRDHIFDNSINSSFWMPCKSTFLCKSWKDEPLSLNYKKMCVVCQQCTATANCPVRITPAHNKRHTLGSKFLKKMPKTGTYDIISNIFQSLALYFFIVPQHINPGLTKCAVSYKSCQVKQSYHGAQQRCASYSNRHTHIVLNSRLNCFC